MRWPHSYQGSRARRSCRDLMARSCPQIPRDPLYISSPSQWSGPVAGREARPRGGRPQAMVLTLLSLPVSFSPFLSLPSSCSVKKNHLSPVSPCRVSCELCCSVCQVLKPCCPDGEWQQKAYTSVLEGPMAAKSSCVGLAGHLHSACRPPLWMGVHLDLSQ